MMTFRKTLLASATAMSLAMTAPAFADGHDQLLEQVTNGMVQLEVVPAGFEYLTPDDLAQIKAILESDDQNDAKVERIEEVITTREEAEGDAEVFLITNDLRDQIDAHLTGLGYDVDVEALEVQQIAEIKAVLDSDDNSSAEAKARIDAALAM